eukprot:scaffold54470_cov65-Phaeocystis_antarctica.AAC.1
MNLPLGFSSEWGAETATRTARRKKVHLRLPPLCAAPAKKSLYANSPPTRLVSPQSSFIPPPSSVGEGRLKRRLAGSCRAGRLAGERPARRLMIY